MHYILLFRSLSNWGDNHMNTAKKCGAVAVFMIFLIISMPIVFATEINIQTDANGNIVTDGTTYREYNSLNQLIRIRNGSTNSSPMLEEYEFHPTQEKIYKKKIYNSTGQVAETVIYFTNTFIRVKNVSGTFDYTYVRHDGQLVAQLNPDGSKLYMHADHEGSTSIITNQSGQIVENTTYSPYGEILSGGTVSRFDSEGKEFSSVTGDYDFNFRKFCVQFGIFCQPDTLIPNVYDPQSLNRYMFERWNPYEFFLTQ